MDIKKFKKELKLVLANNKQPIIFYIAGKEFKTKHKFGLKLLELFKDDNIEEIYLSSVNRHGLMGDSVVGFDWVLINKIKDIESMKFFIVRKEKSKIQKEYLKNRSSKQSWMDKYGSH